MTRIEIYGKQNCASCTKAKMYCESRGWDFSYLELDRDFTREDVLEKFPGARTFPQVRIHGQNVGGFEDFMKYIDDTGFSNSGHG